MESELNHESMKVTKLLVETLCVIFQIIEKNTNICIYKLRFSFVENTNQITYFNLPPLNTFDALI